MNDMVLSKIQEQVGESKNVRDEITKSFTDWFQGHVTSALALTQSAPAEEGGEGETEGAA